MQLCTIIVDVGATYDPIALRFDHHQKEFSGVLEGFHTKLSRSISLSNHFAVKFSVRDKFSAGLVYQHFGKDILNAILSEEEPYGVSEEVIATLYLKLYKNFLVLKRSVHHNSYYGIMCVTRSTSTASTMASRLGRESRAT